MNKRVLSRVLLAAAVAACIVAFWAFDLGRFLTLSYVRESLHRFMALYEQHWAAVIAAYMAIYILVTSLSLPGAVPLTLAGGGLFGLLTGTVVVSFASTIGATLACAVSRYVLRDWVQAKFGDRLVAVNKGIDEEGAFYLFTLRLIPVFPFFVINLVMGLTQMPLTKFYIVSQIGMLPGTVVYVNAGRELAKIESLSGILSPGLILSFALLGLFPLVTKRLVAWYRKRRGERGAAGKH